MKKKHYTNHLRQIIKKVVRNIGNRNENKRDKGKQRKTNILSKHITGYKQNQHGLSSVTSGRNTGCFHHLSKTDLITLDHAYVTQD